MRASQAELAAKCPRAAPQPDFQQDALGSERLSAPVESDALQLASLAAGVPYGAAAAQTLLGRIDAVRATPTACSFSVIVWSGAR